jgi:nitrate/nitrite transport system permease protein
MVSAVFHSPAEAGAAELGGIASHGAGRTPARPAAQRAVAADAAITAAAASPVAAAAPPTRPARSAQMRRQFWLRVLPPVIGIAMLIAIWALLTFNSKTFPTPLATFKEAARLFADPFYRHGPNDIGIGWNILYSLERVALGFGLAALVGIPMGFLIGRFQFLDRMVSPLVSLLRPVSPLAWLPIGLLVFKAANPAAIWTIFICSIWPMIINTAVGVQRVPQDYLNVARVLNLSEWKVITRILLPSVLPYMLTGVRLSVGTAWLVIVAAEMLTGGVGIGFWVWDEWNNLNVAHILIAIFVIGIVGLLLEQLLISVAQRFSFDG